MRDLRFEYDSSCGMAISGTRRAKILNRTIDGESGRTKLETESASHGVPLAVAAESIASDALLTCLLLTKLVSYATNRMSNTMDRLFNQQ